MNGMVESSHSQRVYVDANPIAYALEGPEELATALKGLFSVFQRRRGSAVTSELTLAEVLPKRKMPDRYFFDLLIWSGIFDLLPVTRDILIETATYRRIARTELPDGRAPMPKLPDAIHAVTAIRNGCQIFLSSDRRIRLPQSIQVVFADKSGIETLTRELA